MRRPTLGHRFSIWLCGVALAAGCNQYPARQDTSIVATAPAKTTWAASNSATAAPRAEFDFQAVKANLASASPYCPLQKVPLPDTVFTTPLVAAAHAADRCAPGVGGVPLASPDGPPGLQQVGLVTEGTLPDSLPVGVESAAKGLPITPPLHAPGPELGFEEFEECCPVCTPALQPKLAAIPAGCFVPCSDCGVTPACTAASACVPMTCNACTPCNTCASTLTNTCATCNACAAAAPAPPEPPSGAAIASPPRFPRGETAPRRKSFVDITASPCFGHAPDYSWLSGQVEYSRILTAWRLRYASVDETDRYAGSVTLVENAHVGYLRDGEYVRVVGHLVNPSADRIAPAYRIESFKVIDNPNDPSSTPVITTASAP